MSAPCVCSELRKAARAVTRVYDEAFRPMGYRATQIAILMASSCCGPVTLSELAEETVTDRTTLTRNLRLLRKKGLICVERGADRREQRICATQLGQAVLRKAAGPWREAQRRMVEQVGKTRLKRLIGDLACLHEKGTR